jgi:hypothetical protein
MDIMGEGALRSPGHEGEKGSWQGLIPHFTSKPEGVKKWVLHGLTHDRALTPRLTIQGMVTYCYNYIL